MSVVKKFIDIYTLDPEDATLPFAMGRKNWLFCDTVKEVKSSGIVYLLMETARANGIAPYNYLFYTLSLLPYFWKSPAHEKLEALMSWHLEVQKQYNKKLQSETEYPTNANGRIPRRDPAVIYCGRVIIEWLRSKSSGITIYDFELFYPVA